MLNSLEILNGSMTPSFNENIYEYVVNVDSTAISLDLNYTASGNVTIYGNDYLTDGENHVIIEVFDNKLSTYTLIVYKASQNVMMQKSDLQKAEISIKNDVLEDITIPLIACCCFILIVIVFCKFFGKKIKRK